MSKRDKDHFDTKIFNFANSKIKKILKKEADKQNLSMFYIMDEAYREYLEKRGHTDIPIPKVPKLV